MNEILLLEAQVKLENETDLTSAMIYAYAEDSRKGLSIICEQFKDVLEWLHNE